jgi:hypothetical protein
LVENSGADLLAGIGVADRAAEGGGGKEGDGDGNGDDEEPHQAHHARQATSTSARNKTVVLPDGAVP